MIFLWIGLTLAYGESKEPSRSKNLNFEESIVEGMNKRPLDSLNELAEANRKEDETHLYKKRGGFRWENTRELETLRYTQ